MNSIILGASLFLEVIQFFVLIDIVLSWVSLTGVNLRPKFIASVLDPLYSLIRKNIPVSVGPFDFSAFIIIVSCMFLKGTLILLFPSVFVL